MVTPGERPRSLPGVKKDERRGMDQRFGQLCKDGKKLDVEIEALTICERICLKHDAHFLRLS